MATASLVPTPPPIFFFVLWFAFSIIHRSWRVAKNGEGLEHITWMTSGGCEVDVGGGGGYPTTFVCDKPFLLVKSSTVDLMNVWGPGYRWSVSWSLVRYLNVDPPYLSPPCVHQTGPPPRVLYWMQTEEQKMEEAWKRGWATATFNSKHIGETDTLRRPFACIHNVWLKFSSLHIHVRGREGRGGGGREEGVREGREGGGRVQIVSSYYAAVCMAVDNKHGPLKPITVHNQVTWHVSYCCHGTYHLPDLQYVVLRDAAQHPGFIGVPGKIWNFSCVAPVDKLEREEKQTLLK